MRWMVVVAAVACIQGANPSALWAKPNPHWHTPKCKPTNDPGKLCTHDPGAKVTAIVAIDHNQVVLVEPDPLIVCAGDTVTWVLVNACDDKVGCNAKKIALEGIASLTGVFKDCTPLEKKLDAGQTYSATCTVKDSPY